MTVATEPGDREDRLRALSEADGPGSRTRLFQAALDGTGEGPLRLGRMGTEGATLDGIHPRWDGSGTAPPWWDVGVGGVRLGSADLAGARLNGAQLPRADLRTSALVEIVAREADFSSANLEQANFGGSDLGGALFVGAQAHEADFSDAMLEDARFTRASLRFASFGAALLEAADFADADLWGADLKNVEADEANFTRARCDEADLSGGNFSQADFSGASLKKIKAVGARLKGANFVGAKLDGAVLDGADLSNASLPRVNLLTCSLRHVRLSGAWLENTRVVVDQFGGAVGEELAGEYYAARNAYVALEQNFRMIGNSDAASWAFRKGRRMGKLHERQTTIHAWRTRHPRKLGRHGLNWAADGFVEWLCDYGESLGRVLRAFFVTILVFALFYGTTGSLTRATIVTRNPVDLLAYSFLNMLSTSAPDIGLKPISPALYFVSGLQGALGIVLIGLFGFVLGNRMRH